MHNRHRRNTNLVVALWLATTLVSSALSVALVVVAIHFIAKWW